MLLQYFGLILTTLAVYFFIYILKDFNYWKKKNVPYISPFSYYGNILPLITLNYSVNQYFDVLHKETMKLNSKFIGFWVAEKPSLYLSCPELIKNILVKNFDHFNDRLVGHKATTDSLGSSSLFLLKQNHWKNMRVRLNHLFTSGKIRKMEQIICGNSNNMLEFIEQHRKVNGNEPLNCRDLASRYAADNIIQIYLGLDGQCLKDMPGKKLKVENANLVPKYNDIGNSLVDVTPHRAWEFICFFIIPEVANFFRFKFFSHSASDFLREIFWAAVTLRKQNETNDKKEEKQPRDLLDLLIQFENDKVEVDGKKYQGETLPAQFAILFIAGFETSSSSVSLFLATMTQYPEIQDRVREEIKTIISKHGKLNYDSLLELTYLDMSYRELLRLYPVLPFLDRLCTKTYKTDDLIIEKGTKVFISLTGIQLDPRYWKNPHKYDPERFSSENKSNITPYTYMPFGAGPKTCIGERVGFFQSKMGIATILSQYRVRADGTLKSLKDLRPGESYESLRIPMETRGVTITPKAPLSMYLDYMPVND